MLAAGSKTGSVSICLAPAVAPDRRGRQIEPDPNVPHERVVRRLRREPGRLHRLQRIVVLKSTLGRLFDLAPDPLSLLAVRQVFGALDEVLHSRLKGERRGTIEPGFVEAIAEIVMGEDVALGA